MILRILHIFAASQHLKCISTFNIRIQIHKIQNIWLYNNKTYFLLIKAWEKYDTYKKKKIKNF